MRRMSQPPLTSRRAKNAAHARLGRLTGQSGNDLRLAKHRALAREAMRADWRLLPSVEVLKRMRLPRVRKSTCQATTRTGRPCRALALENGRCRLHGGLSTGPKTPEGWERTRAGYQAWLARRRRAETSFASQR